MALIADLLPSRLRISAAHTRRAFIYCINYAPEIAGVGRYSGELGGYLSQHDVNVEIVTAIPHYPGWAVSSGFRNQFSVEPSKGARVTRCPLLLKADTDGIRRMLAPLTFAITSVPVAIWRILRDHFSSYSLDHVCLRAAAFTCEAYSLLDRGESVLTGQGAGDPAR